MNWFFFRFFFFFGLYLLVSCGAAAKSTFTLGVVADWKRDDFCTYFACREQNWYVRDEKLIRQPPPNLEPCPSRGVRCNDCGQSWAFPDRWKAPWLVEVLCNFVEDCNLIWQSKEHFFEIWDLFFGVKRAIHYVFSLAWFRSYVTKNAILKLPIDHEKWVPLKRTASNIVLWRRIELPSSQSYSVKVSPTASYLPAILENPNIWSSLSVLDFHVLLHAFLEKIKQSIQLVPDNADLFSFLRFLFLSFLRAR